MEQRPKWWAQAVCPGLGHLFFGPEEDGRNEVGRKNRERICRSICFRCPVRLLCLQGSIERSEELGVWGGMAEGERRRFLRYLRSKGYMLGEAPEGEALTKALNSFYKSEKKRR